MKKILSHPLTLFYFLIANICLFGILAFHCIKIVIASKSNIALILGIMSIIVSVLSFSLIISWIKKYWKLSKTFVVASFLILGYILITIFWSKIAIIALNYAIYHPSFLSILAAILITILATLDFSRVLFELKTISNPSSNKKQ